MSLSTIDIAYNEISNGGRILFLSHMEGEKRRPEVCCSQARFLLRMSRIVFAAENLKRAENS